MNVAGPRHPSNVVFLLPHPDDEMGVFPWLRRAAQTSRVRCVYLTDGGYGGQDVGVREAESRGVLARLGVYDLRFLGREAGLPDGKLHENLARLAAVLPAALEDLAGPVDLYAPAWEGGHQDHDAAHLAGVWLAGRVGAALYQFPLYTGNGLPGPFFRMFGPLEGGGAVEALRVPARERLECLRYCLAYRSQWRSLLGLLPLYALAMAGAQPFRRQRIDGGAYATPSRSSTPLYQRRGVLDSAAFDAATASLRRELAADHGGLQA